MNATRLAYDDAAPTPAELREDCLAVQESLTRPLAAEAVRLSQEQPKRGVEIPEAAARLARAIYGD